MVVSGSPGTPVADGTLCWATSVSEAFGIAAHAGAGEVLVVGGRSIYEEALPLVDRIVLTRIHRNYDGDVRMPRDWLAGFTEVGRDEEKGKNEHCSFFGYYLPQNGRMSLYCLENHRTEDQLLRMRQLESRGVCLFCPEGLASHSGLAPVWRSESWTVAPNDFPYKGTSLHLLLIPDEHVTDLVDLSTEARAGLFEALAFARAEYDLQHYGLGVRNGRCEFTGGTIRHLHMHVLVGDPGLAAETPVRMRFSSAPIR